MMNCEKHLNKIVIDVIAFSALLLILGCTEEQRKDEYIARVNDSYLTREEFASLVDTSKLNGNDKDQIIKDWIYTELLFQEAKKEGITKQENYNRISKNSSRQLAAALFLNEFSNSDKISFSDSDLLEYYESNKNYFRANTNYYLLNRVYFNSEDKAIKFRVAAIESDWNKAVSLFNSDSALKQNLKLQFVEENDIYPISLLRIIKDINPQEISTVITENTGYYSIVQLVDRYSKDSVLPFEQIKNEVKKRLVAEKRTELIENYLKELYSKNEIEIKNEN